MRHIKLLKPLILVFIATFTGLISFAQTVYEAKLTGAQEALPVLSRGEGMLTATLNGNQLEVSGSFMNLETPLDPNVAGGAHLHIGLLGENGPVAHLLTTDVNANMLGGSWNTMSNTFTLSNAEVEALEDREMYVNVHTTGAPGGELRGQLVPQGATVYTMHLFGSNEVPSIITEASGALLLDIMNGTLTVSGAFSGLEGDFDASIAGGAHLHNGLAGENGPVEIVLNSEVAANLKEGAFLADSNQISITTAQEQLLMGRALYANIHTTLHPGGELRGNATANPQSVWRAHLAGYNEVPVVTSSGSGELLIELDGNQLTTSGTFNNLDSPFNTSIAGGAHLHAGMAGETGGVKVLINATVAGNNLGGDFEASNNMQMISDGLIDTLIQRGIYANLHSQMHAPGELRGQVVPTSNYYFNGFMSGNSEVPSTLTTGEGFVTAEILGDQVTVTGSFQNLKGQFDASIGGGSHLHTGLAGTNGPIAQGLVADVAMSGMSGVFTADSNQFTADSQFKEDLRNRALYSNIHTTEVASGELRAQMLHEANAYFVGTLSGSAERPVITSDASGGVVAELVGDQLIFSGSFAGLTSDFDANVAGGSHLHRALFGSNGPVFTLLNADVAGSNRAGEYAAESNIFSLTSGQIDTIKNRMAYVNIHTVDAPGGELRAQLMPLANSYFTANLMSYNAIPVKDSDANGGVMVERVQQELLVSGSFSDLESKVAVSIADGVHIHMGSSIESGPVEFPLNSVFAMDTLSGSFMAMDNRFDADAMQIDNLIDGMNYVNLHTINQASGEIRGQLLADDNQAPEMSMLTSPSNGTMVTVDGNPGSTFETMWNSVADPEGNQVAYIWQLALDTAFDQVLIAQNVADMTTFSTTHDVVDSVLSANGLNPGDAVSVYHRVIATDGSMASMSQPLSVELMREDATGINNRSAANLDVWPNPVQSTLNINTSEIEGNITSIEILNISGQQVIQIPVRAAGAIQTIHTSSLKGGLYFLNVNQDNGNRLTKRIIVQ